MKLLALLLALFGTVAAAVVMVGHWIHNHRAKVYQAANRVWKRFAATGVVRAAGRRFPGLWKFIGARLSPGGYLGLHLTFGLVLSLIAIATFAFVAVNTFSRATMVRADRLATLMVREELGVNSVGLWKSVAFLGNGSTVAVIALGIIIVLALQRKKPLMIGWIAAVVGAWVLETGLKMVFRRTRPEDALIDLPSSYSFPSGHALVSLVTYGMLAYLVWQAVKNGRARAVLVAAFVLVIVCIGFSRIYLGVHYFSDVMGGYAAGVTWLAAVVSGLEVVRRRSLLKQKELTTPAPAS